MKDIDYSPHEAWCDTQNNISERCNCMASFYIDRIEELSVKLHEANMRLPMTNTGWPYEKKLHEELIATRQELERYKRALDHAKRHIGNLSNGVGNPEEYATTLLMHINEILKGDGG